MSIIDDRVVIFVIEFEVVSLEVIGDFIEIEMVEKIVVYICCVEELSDNYVDIFFWSEVFWFFIVVYKNVRVIDRLGVE